MGKEAFAYHAGLSFEERKNIENRIQKQEPLMIVATSALGWA
jgi:superfamily II DNA helicase RecQ